MHTAGVDEQSQKRVSCAAFIFAALALGACATTPIATPAGSSARRIVRER